MTYSMTAFASSELDFDQLSLNCEIRSVNHRYGDISVKTTERFRFAEADIRRIISKKIKRGKIECALSYKKHGQSQQSIHVDMQAVQALIDSTQAIEQLMNNPRSASALELLAFPGIQVEPETDKAALQQALLSLVQTATDNLLAARLREGEQLAKLITLRCEKMQQHVNLAKARLPIVLEQLRSKLKAQIAELVSDPDHERIEQEMVLLSQKLDVDEEIDRLDTHINEVLRVLQQQDPKGRRLDFLMQEMNREANTLGSKSADKEMTAISIELKVLIEQAREQVQNIE